MKFLEILSKINYRSLRGSSNPDILGLSEDSRTVRKGDLFFARKGSKSQGYSFVHEAIEKGASAIVTDQDIESGLVPVVYVESVLEAEAQISNVFYNFPSRSLLLVGVTGTNGKTTFTYLLESIAQKMGWKVGVIGTVNYRFPVPNTHELEILSAPNTTPNALEINRILNLFIERNVDLAIMEVSSHALALGRVSGIEFDGAIFTNLTQDHLDFHLNMESYFLSKLKLFKGMTDIPKKNKLKKFSVVNLDDSYGQRIIDSAKTSVITYGEKISSGLRLLNFSLSSTGTQIDLSWMNQSISLPIKLVGKHNVYNALAVIATAFALGIPDDKIWDGLKEIKIIPGRLESIDCGQTFSVFVDYAHTEDALRNVLNALKPLTKNRLITVFGCGGDRDRSKRPLMGQTAVELSDWVIITSDNPRSEDAKKIALDIEVGIHRVGNQSYEVILDRAEAIQKALKMAKKNDTVLIAGKGHETYQIYANETIHFDDREVIRNYLK